jgi:hypothetical protein
VDRTVDPEKLDDDELDEPVQIARTITAPSPIRVILMCPDCKRTTIVEAKLFARRTRDSDGTTTLALRTKAPKVAHSCDQLGLGLDGAATGDLVR